MTVEIITIGDELLIGQVTDTNSAFMGKILNDNGFKVVHKTVVGDESDDIIKAIDDAHQRVSIVLITGGLGPTKDDITLKTLCKYFDCKMHFSDEVYSNIEQIFTKHGFVMNELTRNQAMVPDKATIIQNQAGTAPCTWFEQNGFVLVSMPGVPAEMKWLMTNEIVPRLKKKFHQDLYIKHQTCWVSGYTESALAIALTDFENNLPPFVKLAYLPQAGIIRLRLSAYCDDEKIAEEAVSKLQKQLEQILDKHIFIEEDKNIEALIGDKLRKKHLKIGTAESCTGGSVAALLTSIPGSSDYFVGSVVAYANFVKELVLGVSADTIRKHGVVSCEVVEQMAKGAKDVLCCDCVIATSGIAGPSGGTRKKPVGTVCIAVALKNKMVSKEFHFSTVREQNIQRTVNTSLLMLLDLIIKK